MVREPRASEMETLWPRLKDLGRFIGVWVPQPAAMAAMATDMLTQDRGVFLVYDDDGIKGLIGGCKGQHIYRPDKKVLQEYFWWVDESARGSGAGGQLIEAFIDAGRDCDGIQMCIGPHTPVPDGYLEKFGFRLTEKAYFLEQ